VIASMIVLVELVGTLADQLPALNQSVEAAPIHWSAARDGVVVAETTSNATTDIALRPRRNRQAKKLATRPRYGSSAATGTQYDSG